MSTSVLRTRRGCEGRFIERMPEILPAGKPTILGEGVAEYFKWYNLQDEADALLSDAVIPPPKEVHLPMLKHRDVRHTGPYTEAAALINPPPDTKFMTLVEDVKSTIYASFWKKPIGKGPDKAPLLPEGFDFNKRLGKKSKFDLSPFVYSQAPGPLKYRVSYQTDRNYCRPAYDPTITFGIKYTDADNRGTKAKCCLTDDRVVTGNSLATPLCVLQANIKAFDEEHVSVPRTSHVDYVCPPLKPRETILGCLTNSASNTKKEFIYKCLSSLNKLRKYLSSHRERNFLRHFYLNLKYIDKEVTGWLPKQDVYKLCKTALITIQPPMIEPLLAIWGAFDGAQIKYKTFVDIINNKEQMPPLPKNTFEISKEDPDYSTAYSDMVKFGQEVDNRRRAGVPSGRYFDRDYPVDLDDLCKAHTSLLVQESDAKSCINPSIMTLMGVSHRDAYAKRSPEVVRKTFERAGIDLTDEEFNKIWEEAKQYHSQGWVCFETFRRAFDKFNKGKPII